MDWKSRWKFVSRDQEHWPVACGASCQWIPALTVVGRTPAPFDASEIIGGIEGAVSRDRVTDEIIRYYEKAQCDPPILGGVTLESQHRSRSGWLCRCIHDSVDSAPTWCFR